MIAWAKNPRSATTSRARRRPSTRRGNVVLSEASRFSRSGLASAFGDVDGEPALRRFLVFRLHVSAGLSHCLDDLIEGHPMRAIAVERKRRRRNRLVRTEGVPLDAGNLDQPANRVAGQAQVMLH